MSSAHIGQEEKDNGITDRRTTSGYHYSGDNRVYQDGSSRTVHRTKVRFVKLIDVIMVSIPFILAWVLYFSHKVYLSDFYRKGNWLVMALFVVIYYLLSHLYSGYSIHISRISEIVYSQSLGALLADGIMFIIMWLLIRHVPNIPVLLLVFGAQFVLIMLWAKMAHSWYFGNNPPVPTVIIYEELEGVENLISYYGLNSHFKIVKKVNIKDFYGEGWYSLPREERYRRERILIPELLQDAEDDVRTVEYIKNYLPQELKERFTDDLLYYLLDVLVEYYADSGILDAQPDAEGYIDIDVEEVANHLARQARKDQMGDFAPDDLRWVVEGEMEYAESLE